MAAYLELKDRYETNIQKLDQCRKRTYVYLVAGFLLSILGAMILCSAFHFGRFFMVCWSLGILSTAILLTAFDTRRGALIESEIVNILIEGLKQEKKNSRERFFRKTAEKYQEKTTVIERGIPFWFTLALIFVRMVYLFICLEISGSDLYVSIAITGLVFFLIAKRAFDLLSSPFIRFLNSSEMVKT